MSVKVTDRRRFDSAGNPRESDAVKCRLCAGVGKIAVDPSPEDMIAAASQGTDAATSMDCPQCDGTGNA